MAASASCLVAFTIRCRAWSSEKPQTMRLPYLLACLTRDRRCCGAGNNLLKMTDSNSSQPGRPEQKTSLLLDPDGTLRRYMLGLNPESRAKNLCLLERVARQEPLESGLIAAIRRWRLRQQM